MTESAAAPIGTGSTPETGLFWSLPPERLLELLASSGSGLSNEEAQRRAAVLGPNRLRSGRRGGAWLLLARQFTNPLVLILVAAAAISWTVDEQGDAAIILAIIVVSGLVGWWQERSADSAVRSLLERVALRIAALRDGRELTLGVDELVPGDVVRLAAGSIVPADLRLLESTNLYVDQAALTGETFPVEKSVSPVPAGAPLAERSSALYAGSHVVSGLGAALVVETGGRTELGRLASRLREHRPRSAFERGLDSFGLMLMRVTGVLLAAVFAATVYLGHPVLDGMLFALALAVGITPELLPAIVAVNLARGARRMAARRVIVKRLAVIEDFGSMDVLCADKTGTLTEGVVHLRGHYSSDGEASSRVLEAAAINAVMQHGLPSPLDETIRAVCGDLASGHRKLDEIPYDFSRKRLSVLVEDGDGPHRLVTKGAVAPMLAICADAQLADGRRIPIDDARETIERLFESWSNEGLRVLAVAERELGAIEHVTADDETGLSLLGFLTFSDLPKAGAEQAIEALVQLGVSLKILTGDNRKVAATVARAVGIRDPRILTGSEIREASADALARLADETDVFAEVEPNQKEHILDALKRAGHIVGFLGDGINDAPALHAADVGISVDGAVDVAKEAAEVVLLEHDLAVVAEGVREGRATFLNTLKYIHITTSANFGNMISTAVAVLFLPFLPLLPKQILLNNFLSDFPALTLSLDAVDPEAAGRPRRWDMRVVTRFMLVFGGVSSLFDLLTFFVLIAVFHASAVEFRTAWFVVSLLTEIAILLVVRTARPFLHSRPSPALIIASVATAGFGLALPYIPGLATAFEFVSLPPSLIATTVAITAVYVLVSEKTKHWFFGSSSFLGHPAERR